MDKNVLSGAIAKFSAKFCKFLSRNKMDQKASSTTIQNFSAKFCNELDKNTNVVSSPLSAEFVLALLTLGTTDPAHSELLTALGIPDDQTIRSSFSKVSSKLKSLKGVTLNVANKVYIMDGGYDLQPAIKADAVQVFDAEMEKMDFNNAEESARQINSWVEKKTNNKINNLFSPNSFDEFTRLVLVNALYFKGSWANKFKPAFTKDRPFHIDAATTVNIPMMSQENDFYIGDSRELNAELLAMPYEGGEARLLIVLPNEVEGLPAVMEKLAGGYNLFNDVHKMYVREVDVTIPKFKIETEIDLNELLPKLGIKQIFEKNNSGLTKIIQPNEPLYVSRAVQKAFIEVNEEGTEAAAASGMMIQLCCMPPSFNVDRPFLYLLTDSDHTTLFVGVFRGK